MPPKRSSASANTPASRRGRGGAGAAAGGAGRSRGRGGGRARAADDFEDYDAAAAAFRRGHSGRAADGEDRSGQRWGIPTGRHAHAASSDEDDDYEYDGFSDEALSSSAMDGDDDFEEVGGSDGDDDDGYSYDEEDDEEEDSETTASSGEYHRRRLMRNRRRDGGDDDDFAEAEPEPTKRRPMTPTTFDVYTPDTAAQEAARTEPLPCCELALPCEVFTGHAPADCETRLTRIVLTLEPVPMNGGGDAPPAASPIAVATATHGPVPLFASPKPLNAADGADAPAASPVLPHLATPAAAAPGSAGASSPREPRRKSTRSERREAAAAAQPPTSAFENAVPPDAVVAAGGAADLESHHVDWSIRLVLRIFHDPTTIPAEMAGKCAPPNPIPGTRPPCQHTDLVLCELSPCRPQVAIASTIPAGSTYTLHAAPLVGGDPTIPLATLLPDVAVRVALKGEHVPRAGGTNLFVHQRWFTTRPNITKAPLTSGDGDVSYAPPGTVIEVQRAEGNVLYLADTRDHVNHGKRGLKDAGAMPFREKLALRCSQRVVADLLDWMPYRKVFTPARVDKPVRIRRFPHRNADVIGVLAHGASAVARGQTRDPATGDVYVVWDEPADGAFSRLRGDGGLFLVETGDDAAASAATEDRASNGNGNATKVTALTPSQWYCPSAAAAAPVAGTRGSAASQAAKGVPVRASISARGHITGHVERNEVREAVALHEAPDGRVLLQWGGTGGFSLLREPGGPDQFVKCPPLDQPLRCRMRTSRLPAERDNSPEIIELPHPSEARRRRRRGRDADGDVPHPKVPLTSEDGPEAFAAARRQPKNAHVFDAADTDPQLYELREKLGTISFAQYPRIALGEGPAGGESDDDAEDDDSYDSDSDDDGAGPMFGSFF